MAFNPKADGTLALMLEFDIPITRESYLACAGLTPDQALDGEIAEELIEIGVSLILPESTLEN
jgi:hypothetical protein